MIVISLIVTTFLKCQSNLGGMDSVGVVCLLALVDVLHTWHKALEQSQSARIMFVDFSIRLLIVLTIQSRREKSD